jgi:hypothetical protein
MELTTNGAFQFGNVPVHLSEITDGLSNTILAGEKHVPQGTFGVGGLDSSQYNGDVLTSCTRPGGRGVGLAQSLDDPAWKFGSYHRNICQFVFCDGSVHALPSTTDIGVLGLLTTRDDGQVIPPY